MVDRRNLLRISVALVARTMLPLCPAGAEAGAPAGPNIVLILADDQGWNALSVPADPDVPGSGSTYYRTPRLARLAREGMRFSQGYSPAPTCSPTRYSIQFGRSPASLKIWGADGIGRNIDAKPAESLANRLKAAAPEYACAHLGKWHIAFSPKELGYDVDTGSGANLQSKDPRDPKFIFSLTEKAGAFMAEQVKAGRPFFLQISHYADHLRYAALPETVEKYETRYAGDATKYQKSPLWAAMNENLDTGVGMVLDRIDELGIRDNTYVIYTADNGYEDKKDFGRPVHERGYYKAHPQRSHKYHVSEGGIRVPFIVRGPGIPADAHSRVPVVGTDVFPTVLEILGAPDRVPAKVEGASLLGHLRSGGAEPVRRRDPFLVFKYSKPRPPHDIAIVRGRHKLIKDIDTGRVFLFDLRDDIGESRSLADEKPDMAKRMYEDMTAYLKRFGWDESMISTEKRKGRKRKR
ncbi:MAG: sulfatase-like hydrolase/transferase [Planctomycetota bacterium]|jgi:arylsulfatase A-like enzyme